ncbi:response regulator transcription factor [Prauserella flavalba]|uniref:response regulator transcription factor n=1 Tax=Prauserella flavalba TaxID=1477506 RepID=UPI001AEFB438|nr:response regulator transcription factor [Prauserella flavalba]
MCDDHGIIRSGIRRILEGTPDFQLRAAAPTGKLLVEAIEQFRPELAVVDIRLPDGSGLDLLESIAAISPSTNVVMLSMYGARGYVEKAKTRGARGYITKECLEEELIEVLHAVMADDKFVSYVREEAISRDVECHPTVDVDILSSRELEVLKLIAAGLTNSEVADELRVSPRTVESHRASVQRKLLVRTRAELTRVAREAGLLD